MGIEAAILGGTLAGALISGRTSNAAAKSQSQAATEAAELQYYGSLESAAAIKDAAAMGAEATIVAAEMGAEATRYAADQSTQTQLEMYAQATESNAPYTAAGRDALATLQQMMADGPGEFTEDPGYQFRLEQGNQNILSNAAATGNLASGRTMKALQEFGQDYASHEYQNFINRYYQSLQPYQFLTSVGQSAAALQGNNAMAAGANIGNTQMQMGTNLASIYNAQGANLAGIYNNMGTNLANVYQGQANSAADTAMTLGNISAANSINQANAWTGAINNGLMAYGMFGGAGVGSGGYSTLRRAAPAYNTSMYNQQTLQNLPVIF